MSPFLDLLRRNRNYRHLWLGQVVSEIGDHFNNIAVLALAMRFGDPGLVVMGVMLARAVPAIFAGPFAGVVLDRFDRRQIMILSDLARMVMALGFIASYRWSSAWALYSLSAGLMLASPFFTAGRSSILPRIATAAELHTANSLTQTTSWTNTLIGSLAGGTSVAAFGYEYAFVINSLSFAYSAWAVWQLRVEGGFRAERRAAAAERPHPLRDYRDGLRYMAAHPFILAMAMVSMGWALGGGAAQMLFALFGDKVFQRGAAGIGTLYGAAGFGLVLGGILAHRLGKELSFPRYKQTIGLCWVIHGGTYVLFALAPNFWMALAMIALSRAAAAISGVLNFSLLLRTVEDEFRGRVFATLETFTWAVMILSTGAAGLASQHVGPRTIGVWAGIASSMTAVYWTWANLTGRLPEPRAHAAPLS